MKKIEKIKSFNVAMKNMVTISKMLETYGLTVNYKSTNKRNRNFTINVYKRIITIPKDIDYGNKYDLYAICHEIGHYIDCRLIFKDSKWRRIIKGEIKAWQFGKREYEIYFGEITQEMKEDSIHSLLSHIGYHRYKFLEQEREKKIQKLIKEKTALNRFDAVNKLGEDGKVPMVIYHYEEAIENKENVIKHLNKLLGY